MANHAKMTFVDSHMHFWDRELMPYTWLHEVPTIWDRHTLENLHQEASEHLPEKIVFVECGAPWLEELMWVEKLASTQPRICGIVAKATVNAGAQTLADISVLRKHPLVRGARHHFEHEKDPDYCCRSEFIHGVKELAAAGLSFDICCKHPMLPAVIELVRQCPEAQFILDHAGKPGIRAGLLDPWRNHIRTLAEFPNIVCKFSGLVTEADHEHWTFAQLRPFAEHLFETFAPRRLLFGGDWPVAKLASGYVRWLETAHELASAFSSEEQAMMFGRNAERIYRI
jgi:L-fuconolactonase